MNNTDRLIGFDRKIELGWLDTVAGWAAADLSPQEIEERFPSLLATIDQGNEARRKNKTVLTTTWLRPSDKLLGFHNEGLDLFRSLSPSCRIALHWGACMATYPFFAFVAYQIGRLHRLQGDATTTEIRRRVIERYGDTERVKRSLRHVIQTFHHWHVLYSDEKGVYKAHPPRHIEEPRLIAWLTEAYLYAFDLNSASLSAILTTPAFFPFDLPRLTPYQISRHNARLEAIQDSGSQDMVALVTVKTPASNGKPVL